jgi:hypothetical protein
MTTPPPPAAREQALTKEQIDFLLCLLKEHREYYRLLCGSSQLSTGNLGRHKFIESLWNRLEEMQRNS